jgi:hypothetical protein
MPPLLLLQEINVTFEVTTLLRQVHPLALLLAAPNLRRGARLRR